MKNKPNKKATNRKGTLLGGRGSTHLKLELGRQKIVYIFMFSALQVLLYFCYWDVNGTRDSSRLANNVDQSGLSFLLLLFICLFVFKVPKSHCLLDQYKTCIRVAREKRYGISLHTSDGVETPHYWVLCYTIVFMSSLFSPSLSSSPFSPLPLPLPTLSVPASHFTITYPLLSFQTHRHTLFYM